MLITVTFDALSGDGRTCVMGIQPPDHLDGSCHRLKNYIPAVPEVVAYPSLSADGRFVSINKGPQVYVYDRDFGDGDGMPGAWRRRSV